MLFLDLRDSSGDLQAVSAPEEGGGGGAHGRAERLRQEWVVRVSGELRLRKDPNPRMPTGTKCCTTLSARLYPQYCVTLCDPCASRCDCSQHRLIRLTSMH